MSDMLIDHVTWESYPVPSVASIGNLPLHVGRVGSGGPVGLLTASVHGDEGPWGTRALRKLLESTPFSDLKGSLRIVPVANPMGYEANARNSHLDQLDLNASFPGDPGGSHTQRLAHVLATNVIDGVDVVLDVHGGGSWNVNCFVYRFPGSHDVAEWIGAPFVRDGPDRPSSLTGYARSKGAKGVWIEMGGAGANEEQWAERIATGLRRALGKSGILTEANLPEAQSMVAGQGLAMRCSAPGLYLPTLREGDVGRVVPDGTVIGHLLDPVTNAVLETFHTPFPQTALVLLRPTISKIEGGGLIAALAKID